jgi:hypothetical protein
MYFKRIFASFRDKLLDHTIEQFSKQTQNHIKSNSRDTEISVSSLGNLTTSTDSDDFAFREKRERFVFDDNLEKLARRNPYKSTDLESDLSQSSTVAKFNSRLTVNMDDKIKRLLENQPKDSKQTANLNESRLSLGPDHHPFANSALDANFSTRAFEGVSIGLQNYSSTVNKSKLEPVFFKGEWKITEIRYSNSSDRYVKRIYLLTLT